MDRIGSAKRGIVSTDLLEERGKCTFDLEAMRLFLSGGPAEFERQSSTYDLMRADPELVNYVEFSDLTPHEA